MKTTIHKKLILATFSILLGNVSADTQNEPKVIIYKPDSENSDKQQMQEKIFQKGENHLWLGHGFINLDFEYYDFFGNDELESSYSLGALFFKYEYAVSNKIGLGLNISYLQNSSSYRNNYDLYTMEENYSSLSILTRFNRHFYVDNNWDLYLGTGIGYKKYYSESITTENNPVNVSTNSYEGGSLNMELSIGARLKLSKGVCIYSEFGATKSLFQLGMTFNLSSEN